MEEISPTDDLFAGEADFRAADDGPSALPALPYARLSLRILAFSADILFLAGAISFMAGAAMNIGWFREAVINSAEPGAIFRFLIFFFHFSAAVYCVLGVSIYGATLGKWLTGVKVVRQDGSPVCIFRAFVRFLMYYPGILIFGLGFLMAAADPRGQALHDKIAGTVVLEIQ